MPIGLENLYKLSSLKKASQAKMSAKLLHTLTDENPDLQKRIGCMNGILQLFDRQHFISSRRVNHKSLPSPGDIDESETNSVLHYVKGGSPKKVMKERQKFSSESSRTSFSSSPSSTFSSLDCNKIVAPEATSACQSVFLDTLVRNHSLKQSNASPQFRMHSPDIRDVVKDSINREAFFTSVKTSPKDTAGHKLKHVDSPRPLQPTKPVKPRVSSLHESFRGIGKLKEDPCGYRGGIDGRRYLPPKDAPRFSYDERESRDASKSSMKLRELPRLSLDSRTGPMRNSASSYVKGMGNQNSLDEKFGQEPGSNKRPPSVVAKLMGLDVVQDVIPTKEANIVPSALHLDGDLLNGSHKGFISSSPRSTRRDAIANQSRTAGSIMKTTSTLRIPIEPAPWKQADASRGLQKHNSSGRTVAKDPNSVPSVYGEIEKRLAELEFKKSSKDLRALKQILGAMQRTKEILESKRDNQVADTLSQTSNSSSNQSTHHQNSGVEVHRNLYVKDRISTPTKVGNSPKTNRSVAVIARTGKGGRTSSNQAPSANPIEGLSNLQKIRTSNLTGGRKDFSDRNISRDQTPKNHLPRETSSPSPRVSDKSANGRIARLQTSRVPPHDTTRNSGSGRSSGAVSPNLIERQTWLENQPHPPTPSSARRQPVREQVETGSQGRKTQQRSPLQKFGYHSNQEADFLHSDRIISLSPRIDTKTTSNSHSDDICSFSQIDHNSNNLEARPRKLRSLAEFAIVTPEQPSPISVLDAMFCAEDLPSPVKKTSISLEDVDTRYSGEPRWREADLTDTSGSTKSILSFEIDQKKLKNVELLVQELRKLTCNSNDSCTDYAFLLFDSRNQDHRYIYRILSASGFLQDLSSGLTTIQLHASKQVIDPKLFLVLEQTGAQTTVSTEHKNNKTSLQKMNSERIQRKFIFDALNEILLRKVVLASSAKVCSLANMQEGGKKRCQRLFTELCSEIDQLQSSNAGSKNEEFDYDSITDMLWEDLKQQPQNWTDSRDEILGLVLDVERQIFKDLINEIVSGEFTSKRAWPTGTCRKLF